VVVGGGGGLELVTIATEDVGKRIGQATIATEHVGVENEDHS
jgi:hypothetical protein